ARAQAGTKDGTYCRAGRDRRGGGENRAIGQGCGGAGRRIARPTQLQNYAPSLTLAKIMTRVYNARDSISTSPSSKANRIAADAPGLRAMASAEEATALACASPQRPEAMAMAKPDVMATHLLTSSAPLISAPNIGLAHASSASRTKNSFGFIVCYSSYEFASGGGSRHPLTAGLTLTRDNAVNARALRRLPRTSSSSARRCKPAGMKRKRAAP